MTHRRRLRAGRPITVQSEHPYIQSNQRNGPAIPVFTTLTLGEAAGASQGPCFDAVEPRGPNRNPVLQADRSTGALLPCNVVTRLRMVSEEAHP